MAMDIENASREVMDQFLKDKVVVNKGTVVIKDTNDEKMLEKYLDALKRGDETYRPPIFEVLS
jgi:hypothetical protein